MSRKTVKVTEAIDTVNKMIASYPIGETPEQKETYKNIRFGMGIVIERILLDTNNYVGFSYLDITEEKPYKNGETDESRRRYMTSNKLT